MCVNTINFQISEIVQQSASKELPSCPHWTTPLLFFLAAEVFYGQLLSIHKGMATAFMTLAIWVKVCPNFELKVQQ